MFQKEEKRCGDEEEYETGYGQHQKLKRELDGKDWCQRIPSSAKALKDDSEVRLHEYSKIMKPCACLMCHQPAEGKTQQRTLRDKLGWDLSHQILMIWKLSTVKRSVAISPRSLQGEQTCPAAFTGLGFR